MAIKYFRKRRAQVIGEYVILIALVVMVMAAMTIFLRRALQARIKDAKDTMMTTVRDSHNGTIPDEYEPYYLIQNSEVTRAAADRSYLKQGGISGVYQKILNETTTAQSESTYLPARDAD